MAKFTLGRESATRGFNFNEVDGGVIPWERHYPATPEGVTFYEDKKNYTSITGTGLTYVYENGQIEDLIAGRITGFKHVEKGSVIFDATGLSISAKEFVSVIENLPAALKLMFKGNDTITGTSLADLIRGFDGNDKILAGAGNDKVYGEAGNDTLYGGTGNDTLDGGSGNDKLFGDAGNDKLYGGSGDDRLDGGTGNDTLYGGTGNDVLYGGAGDDKLYGDSGNDSLYGGRDNDRLDGGAGNDKLYGEAGNDALYGGTGNDRLDGEAGNDKLYGGSGNDTIFGGTGNDKLYGDAGHDKLYGDSGNDTILGGTGDDFLFGGLGNDILTGGLGKDTFVFDTKIVGKTNIDTITDFNVKDDEFQLSKDDFAGLGKAGTKLAAGAFVIGTKALDANDRVIYDKATGALYYDEDGSGAHAAVQFATVSKGLALSADDFFIIA